MPRPRHAGRARRSRGLAELFGYEHSLLLLLDERRRAAVHDRQPRLSSEGVGSEVRVGEGIIGMAADAAEPMRVGNLGQMLEYRAPSGAPTRRAAARRPASRSRCPGLADAESQVAVPAMVLGQLVGVVAIESDKPGRFGPDDEALLTVVATMVAAAIEIDWAHERAAGDAATGDVTHASGPGAAEPGDDPS